MSGLYNMIFGDGHEQERGVVLCTLIGITDLTEFGRFRDAWLEETPSGLRIAVYTRNGGGNRQDYEDVTNKLRANPYYLDDVDDEFDSTYATYWFRIPDQAPAHLVAGDPEWATAWPETLVGLRAVASPVVDMSERWQKAIDKLNEDGPTEAQAAAFAPLAKQLQEAFGDANVDIHVAGRDPKRFTEEDAIESIRKAAQ